MPLAIVMISLNEAHNMESVLTNLKGWASEVFLVDSFSSDSTVEIALRHGVHVVQRRFRGFGDQWNFAIRELPITAPWTMKLDPDERLTDELKLEIAQKLDAKSEDAFRVPIRLHFMGRRLPHVLRMTRIWRTGTASFSDVLVNEHLRVTGPVGELRHEALHCDSPNLDHWITKQNRYSTAEARSQYEKRPLAESPNLFGNALQRRMWFKSHFTKFPGRYLLLFLYYLLVIGAWRAGRVGWIWARLRTEAFRLREYKLYEMRVTGQVPAHAEPPEGQPDLRVRQYE